MDTSFRSEAIGLAVADEFFVFPLAAKNKVPLKGSNGLRDASNDLRKIREWWPNSECLYNIGIACGEDSNLIVVDLDGPTAFEWYEKAGLPETRAVKTSKGMHYYYKYPDDLLVCNSASKIAEGVDIRAEGGFVVAPPSVHPSGHVYEWNDRSAPIAELPREFLESIKVVPLEPPPKDFVPRQVEGTSKRGRALLQYKVREMENCYVGARNDTLFRVAFSTARLVAGGEIDESEAYQALLGAAYNRGLSNHEATRTIDSGFRRGSQHPKRLD